MSGPIRLSDIIIDNNEKRPLGGLNPYNPHYDRIGQHFCDLLIEHAGLKRDSRILDIGCGTGRLAKPISQLLDTGSYEGIDVSRQYIEYCQAHLAKPNIRFNHVNIKHEEYNPTGVISPMDFKLHHNDNSFDIVTAIAVFNHFETKWVYKYITEMARVLRPKGILFATYLILNPNYLHSLANNDDQSMIFEYRTLDSWHKFQDRPLINVAIPESGLRQQYVKCGLMIKEPIRYGEWCGSPVALTGHDVVIAIKGQWR